MFNLGIALIDRFVMLRIETFIKNIVIIGLYILNHQQYAMKAHMDPTVRIYVATATTVRAAIRTDFVCWDVTEDIAVHSAGKVWR